MSFGSLFLFILQVIVSILLIIVVLLQSSDEDALSGIGAGAGKPGLLTHKSSTSLITKITIILGVILMVNSFILASISTHKYLNNKSIIKDYIEQSSTGNVNTEEATSVDVNSNSNDKVENK